MTSRAKGEIIRPNHVVTGASAVEGRLHRRSGPDHVFSIQELASIIFAFLDASGCKRSLSSCALVCRTWTEAALDQLWKHLDSILPLFELLFNVESKEGLLGPKLMATRRVQPKENVDWARFLSYAQRVKSIDIKSKALSLFHGRRAPPDTSLFTNQPHFRHIRSVKWTACCYPCLRLMAPFISSSITTLELEIKLRKEEAGSLFDFLQGSAPNIQELAITSHHPVDDFDLPLSLWISSLQNLTKLSLPPYYKSTNIVAAAGGLRVLKIFSRTENGFGIPNENGMQMEFQPDTFPELRALEWNSTLPNAIQLLQPSPRVEALESLHLSCSGSNPPTSEVLAFTRGLGKACPRLREITLDLFPDVWTPPLSTEQPLDMGLLDGLAPCQELAVLRVRHPLPTKLDENDVHLIGATWKKLECLVLCPNPSPLGRWPPTGISISALPLLANALPNLTRLGLFFDFNEKVEYSGNLYPQHQFKNLQTLEVGLSSVPPSETEDLAFLLASLCNLSAPTIIAKPNPSHGSSISMDNLRLEGWGRVERILNVAMRTKLCVDEK